MTIFVGGVHGTGKTILCTVLATELGYITTSASALIHHIRGQATWSKSKETRHIQSNQELLIEAVNELRKAHKNILLDGHFALLNGDGCAEKIDHQVFYNLHIDAIILIEDDPASIVQRLNSRDGVQWDLSVIEALMIAERENALAFHRASNIPLRICYRSTHNEILTYLSKLHRRNYNKRIKED